MKFAATIVAFAAAASAYKKGNVTYTTEVVTEYTTFCPEPTTLTYGDKTYTVTKPTTLTITDCPCTVSRPIETTTKVVCENGECHKPNATATYKPKPPPTEPVTAGAGKTVALTGAGLAGLLGLAAFAL